MQFNLHVHRGLASLALLLSACAGGGPVARSFTRPELKRLPLSSLSVLISEAAPVDAPGPLTALPLFAPPRPQDILSACSRCAPLEAAVKARLSALGYASVRFLRPEGQTLRAALRQTGGDALLLIRALPVRRLKVLRDTGERSRAYLGEERLAARLIAIREAVPVHGELLLGQAFLLYPKNGARLWSRQLPELPPDGRPSAGEPILGYGLLRPEGVALPEDLHAQAARAFTARMLARFPPPQAGEPAAAAELAAIDAEAEDKIQRFSDSGHTTLTLLAGWGVERLESELRLNERALGGDFGSGQLGRAGRGRIEAELGYIFSGGMTLSLGLGLGWAPIDFGRVYYEDNPQPTLADPRQRGVSITVEGARLYTSQLQLGRLFWLHPSFAIEPLAGAFFEVYALDAEGLPDPTHLRFGGLLGLGGLSRLSDSLFVRATLAGRLGLDATAAQAIYGLELMLGLGLFL